MPSPSDKVLAVSAAANLESRMEQFKKLKEITAQRAFKKPDSWEWLYPEIFEDRRMWTDSIGSVFVLFLLCILQFYMLVLLYLIINLPADQTVSSAPREPATSIEEAVSMVIVFMSLLSILFIIFSPPIIIYKRWLRHWFRSKYSLNLRVRTTMPVVVLTPIVIFYTQTYIPIHLPVEGWVALTFISLIPLVTVSLYMLVRVLTSLAIALKVIVQYYHPDQEVINHLVTQVQLNTSPEGNHLPGLIGIEDDIFELFYSLVVHKRDHIEKLLIPAAIVLASIGIMIDALSGLGLLRSFFSDITPLLVSSVRTVIDTGFREPTFIGFSKSIAFIFLFLILIAPIFVIGNVFINLFRDFFLYGLIAESCVWAKPYRLNQNKTPDSAQKNTSLMEYLFHRFKRK